MSVSPEPILVLGGRSLVQAGNHRIQRVVAQLRRWGYPLHLVAQVNYREASGADPSERRVGLRAAGPSVVLREEGHDLWLTVRKLPGLLDGWPQDAWLWANVRRSLRRRYRLCIYGHPNNALTALLLARQGFVEKLIYDDWDCFALHPTTRPGLARWGQKWREEIGVRNATAVVSVSRPLAELRAAQGARAVVVAPNGVDLRAFRRARDRRPHRPTLVFMGTLHPAWGADLPVRALPAIAAQIPDIRYLVIGAGPQAEALRRLAYDELGLQKHVCLVGAQEYSHLPHSLAEADIGVLPYREERFITYASSLKAVEYMAAGLPVLATRVGEGAELVEAAQAGAVVSDDPAAWAEAALGLLLDEERYARCARNALRCAAERDWSLVLEPMRKLLEGLEGAA